MIEIVKTHKSVTLVSLKPIYQHTNIITRSFDVNTMFELDLTIINPSKFHIEHRIASTDSLKFELGTKHISNWGA